MASVNRPSLLEFQRPPATEPEPSDEAEPPFFIVARQFPRIAAAIELMWGNRELDEYLHKMIMTDRGDRAGFPKEVIAALLKLHNQHVARFRFMSREDAWAQEDRIDRVKGHPGRK